MPSLDNVTFDALPSEHEFAALLFDMDGTIIDSTEAIVKYWRSVGQEIGVDGDFILKTSHGRRSIDILAEHAPHLANWEHIVPMEARIPHVYATSAVEIPGARALLANLSALPAPHPLWAIVTSGTRGLVQGWMQVMALPPPPALVTAEEVARGKPDPRCYALGAERLGQLRVTSGEGQTTATTATTAVVGVDGLTGDNVLVLEDAPAGIRAGKAAGFRVLAVATTHAVEALREAGADWIVRDLRSVKADWDGKRGVVKVVISDGWVG